MFYLPWESAELPVWWCVLCRLVLKSTALLYFKFLWTHERKSQTVLTKLLQQTSAKNFRFNILWNYSYSGIKSWTSERLLKSRNENVLQCFNILSKSSQIVEEWTVLPQETIVNAIAAFRKRVRKVIEVEDGYIDIYV